MLTVYNKAHVLLPAGSCSTITAPYAVHMRVLVHKSNRSLKLKKTNRIKYKNELDTSLYKYTQAASACVNKQETVTVQYKNDSGKTKSKTSQFLKGPRLSVCFLPSPTVSSQTHTDTVTDTHCCIQYKKNEKREYK